MTRAELLRERFNSIALSHLLARGKLCGRLLTESGVRLIRADLRFGLPPRRIRSYICVVISAVNGDIWRKNEAVPAQNEIRHRTAPEAAHAPTYVS